MAKVFVMNDKYYFNEAGEKVIPTRDEIREVYKMDERIHVIKAEFPFTGWGVQCGFSKFGIDTPYETREEAEKARNEWIESEIDRYEKKAWA